jgi:DNA ligase D-like protein (predicted ligase)
MLCTLVDHPFDNSEWLFETKFDGLRVLGRFDGKSLTLLSRNNQSQNFQFPEVVRGLERTLKIPAIVDGEIVSFDQTGKTSFRALQQRFHLQNAREVEQRKRLYPASIYLFDVLYAKGRDLTGLPLHQRKEILREIVRWSDRVRWTEPLRGQAGKLLDDTCRKGYEGIIGKHKESRYVAGRSSWWLKIKCIGKQEFVIGGFTDPQRSRVGLGALLVGYYVNDARKLVYAGKVGTGYTNETLRDLRARLNELEQAQSPFLPGPIGSRTNIHWVRPRLVAEIAFSEWTQNNLLRQPRFEGLRTDKSPRDCRREVPKQKAEVLESI